jgi:hypothetical protein
MFFWISKNHQCQLRHKPSAYCEGPQICPLRCIQTYLEEHKVQQRIQSLIQERPQIGTGTRLMTVLLMVMMVP